jgi:hypothetical protein
MYVKIGPYRFRMISNIHTNYMNWKYGRNEWEDNHNKFEVLLEKYEDLLQKVYNKTANKLLDKRSDQKIKVRIDRYDIWSMDHTIAHIIHPMLVQLKADKYGGPWVDDEDVPEELRSTSAPPKENGWDIDDNHFKRWDYVLERMTWSFEQIIRKDRETQFYSGNHDLIFVDDEETNMKRMEFGSNNTFKVDMEAQKLYEHEIQKGLNLFAKYYFSLWS